MKIDQKATWRTGLAVALAVQFAACTPTVVPKTPSLTLPGSFGDSPETESVQPLNWREYFGDEHLRGLIDVALSNNQELNIALQEIEIAKNEASARSGAYLPFVDLGGGAGVDKPGRFTREGALEKNIPIKGGKEFPEPLQDYSLGARARWEVDIWHKLRDAEKSAINRFLGSTEGRNFMVTNLVAEIASAYYELLALDTQLALVKQNIEIQSKALDAVRLEKVGARVTELAVRRFEAQVLKTTSLQFDIKQQIVQTENRINFLLGRPPQAIDRRTDPFLDLVPQAVKLGIPSQLIQHRPDIRAAEREMAAAELDVKVAKAAFYPSLNLSADFGLNAYRLGNILETPASLLYALTGEVAGPLINRRAITADYLNANAKQIQAVFQYERAVLNGFVEVSNQVANVQNLGQSFALRKQQVDALTESVHIADTLFIAARADYMEVLLTQRDALESKVELIDTKLRQMQAAVALYRALGGGWS